MTDAEAFIPTPPSQELTPAFKPKASDREALMALEARCEAIREYMEASYGATDARYVEMMATFRELTADGLPHSWQVAVAFMGWAKKYPERLGQLDMLTCKSACSKGWVCDDPERNLWRPCGRCNRGMEEQVRKLKDEDEGIRVAAAEGAGEPTEPAWGSYDEKPEF